MKNTKARNTKKSKSKKLKHYVIRVSAIQEIETLVDVDAYDEETARKEAEKTAIEHFPPSEWNHMSSPSLAECFIEDEYYV